MFDLEQSIADWRKQMLAGGVKAPEVLDELEGHLREDTERQVRRNLGAQEAFDNAVVRIGEGATLKTEFAKVRGTVFEQLRQIVQTLAGIPNYQLATNMNISNPNIEPRWSTYIKAVTFLFPAMFLWLFSVVFVLPKVSQICQRAGTVVYGFGHVPGLIRASFSVGQMMVFLTNHWVLLGGAIIFGLLILEWRFSGWPRYRRAAIGMGAIIFNAVVLLSFAMMIISLVLAVDATQGAS